MPNFFKRSPFISRRIDRVIFATQFVGGFIGLCVRFAQFGFLDFWIGGTIASPVGLVLGILCEKRATNEAKIAGSRVWLAGFITLFLAASSCFFVIPMVANAKANLKKLSTLQDNSIDQIRVYTPFRLKLLLAIDDEKTLSGFIVAAHDAQLNYHGKVSADKTVETWWIDIILRDGPTLELEWSHRSDAPDTGYGMFIATTNNSVSNRGQFISRNLRSWFRENVEKGLR